MDKMLLTPEESADLLGIGRTRVYELMARGLLESVLIGRSRRVPLESIYDFVHSLRQEA